MSNQVANFAKTRYQLCNIHNKVNCHTFEHNLSLAMCSGSIVIDQKKLMCEELQQC